MLQQVLTPMLATVFSTEASRLHEGILPAARENSLQVTNLEDTLVNALPHQNLIFALNFSPLCSSHFVLQAKLRF